MRIKMRVYATLRRYLPALPTGEPAVFELPTAATVGDALDHAGIPRDETKLCFVNGLQREIDYVLAEWDELGLFPPIGGGSEEATINVELWLYGPLAAYAGNERQ